MNYLLEKLLRFSVKRSQQVFIPKFAIHFVSLSSLSLLEDSGGQHKETFVFGELCFYQALTICDHLKGWALSGK